MTNNVVFLSNMLHAYHIMFLRFDFVTTIPAAR